MKYAFIREKSVAFPVSAMCTALGVSTSGYYGWMADPDTSCDRRDAQLAPKIRTVFKEHQGRYGSPRVTAELAADGTPANKKARRAHHA